MTLPELCPGFAGILSATGCIGAKAIRNRPLTVAAAGTDNTRSEWCALVVPSGYIGLQSTEPLLQERLTTSWDSTEQPPASADSSGTQREHDRGEREGCGSVQRGPPQPAIQVFRIS
jgi:hypothetical protein